MEILVKILILLISVQQVKMLPSPYLDFFWTIFRWFLLCINTIIIQLQHQNHKLTFLISLGPSSNDIIFPSFSANDPSATSFSFFSHYASEIRCFLLTFLFDRFFKEPLRFPWKIVEKVVGIRIADPLVTERASSPLDPVLI